MKKTAYLVLPVLVVLIACSCSKSNSGSAPGPVKYDTVARTSAANTLTATIAGVDYKADSVQTVVYDSNGVVTYLTILGYSENNGKIRLIDLEFQSAAFKYVGTGYIPDLILYEYGTGDAAGVLYNTVNPKGSSGTVIVTGKDPGKRTVSGTFNGVTVASYTGTTLLITKGNFSVNY